MAHEFALYPDKTVTYDVLLEALLEHEGHTITVQRFSDKGLEVHLECQAPQCRDNAGIIFLPVVEQAKTITLEFLVRSWFPEDMPDEKDLANGIDDALGRDWHAPDSGDDWWVEFIRRPATDEN